MLIPIFDISDISKNSIRRRNLCQACEKYGFFQIKGHGISKSQIDEVWKETHNFFNLPAKEKRGISRSIENSMGYFDRELTKHKRDKKEIFDFVNVPHPELPDDHKLNISPVDGANQWPNSLPTFKKILKEYFESCTSIAYKILEILSLELDIEKSYFNDKFDVNHSSFIRLNHYPDNDILDSENQKLVAPLGDKALHHHTDAGVLTILLQDNSGGLQAKINGSWVDIEPHDETLVINVGDLMQIWSNDFYKAVLHRVQPISSNSRYSIPFFFNPSYKTLVKPIVKKGEKPRYKSFSWEHFRGERAKGDFGNYGEEIQISHFAI